MIFNIKNTNSQAYCDTMSHFERQFSSVVQGLVNFE